MPRDFPGEERVFHPRAATDVVNNQVTLRGLVPNVHYYSDMVSPESKIPSDDISREKSFAVTIGRKRLAATREIRHEVWYASMIDV